jgi:hypothetical protein
VAGCPTEDTGSFADFAVEDERVAESDLAACIALRVGAVELCLSGQCGLDRLSWSA